MNKRTGNVTELQSISKPVSADAGGGGDGSDERLAAIESRLHNVEHSITDMKAEMRHLATKADLKDMKADMKDMKADLLKWWIGGQIALIGIAAALIKVFMPEA